MSKLGGSQSHIYRPQTTPFFLKLPQRHKQHLSPIAPHVYVDCEGVWEEVLGFSSFNSCTDYARALFYATVH
jgi:hypothetical protein